MKLKLVDSISSPQDVRSLIQELHEYGGWLAHNEIKERVGVEGSKERPTMSPNAKKTLESLDNANPTTADLDALVAELKRYEQSADHLTITLAAPPTGAVKSELVAWCRQNITDELLVNFSFNSTLMGGMVVRHGSRLYDWSWRRQILASRGNFMEKLKSV